MLTNGHIADTSRRDIDIRHPGKTRHADGISHGKMFALCQATHQLARCFGGKLNHHYFMALDVTQGEFTPFIQVAHIFPAILMAFTVGMINVCPRCKQPREQAIINKMAGYRAGLHLRIG